MKNIFIGLITLSFSLPSLFASSDEWANLDSLGNPPVKPRLMLILDSSGSMSETDRFGDIKIDTAKITLSEVLDKIPDGTTNVSLMAYDGCQTKLLVPASNTNMGLVKSRAMNIYPTGKTPIASSIQEAGKILENNSQKTTIILISDGKETCGGDPCAAAKRLKQRPIVDLKTYTVGYSIDDNTRLQLQCVAQASNGEYFDAEDSFSLATVVHNIVNKEVTKTFDEDTDGIRNDQDHCPNTLAGFTVDKNGCEIAYTMPTPFEVGAIIIEPKLIQPTIQQLADYLKAHPEIKKAEIQGHTDANGSEKFNQELSEKRAKFITKLLIKSGVPSKKLSWKGFGETRPIASNDSPLGRQQNRRVEAKFIK
ncbi:MAG: OmpA family protein [Pseudomonadota bacterium]